ncbi:hypothetical protein IGI04_029423 [Brassica rapa subsp. trilocularis]|uniref:Uncharacterized protein n=2 Tax=Brassica campestris TaxID=3711 RepID=A0A8D9HBZ9_BRACM|nr:hypothetical protein IGI04_029423 [Brassica rapa subsp. trilocularis]CAG7896563.1 unnamed protein product [Brassica rapa]
MRIMVINVERHLMKKLFMITVPTNSIQAAKTHSPDSPVQRLLVLYSHSVWFVRTVQLVLYLSSALAFQTEIILPFSALATGSSIVKKSEGSGFPSKQEVSTETGEENEKVAFSAESFLS